MASFINLAGEVQDFDQAKWISTGQSTQQSWSSHGELYCYQTQIIFFLKDLTSLRQTAIKVMKGRVSKKDDEDQNDK